MPLQPALDREAIEARLDARNEWCIFTTLDADGYPHSVALGYYRIGEDVYVGTPANTHKVANVERDPRASLLVTGSKASGDWSGVLLQGDVTVIRDDAERLQIERESRRQRGDEELPERPREGEVILRLTPKRTVTWSFD